MSRLIFAIALLFPVLASGLPAVAADNVPLPRYTIQASNAPCANWLGKYADGKWDGRRPGIIVVTSVTTDCKATVIVAWGINPKRPNEKGNYTIATGTIKGNTLTIVGKKYTTRYTLRGTTVKGKNPQSSITLHKR